MSIPNKLRLELADSKSYFPGNADFPAIRRKKILQLIEDCQSMNLLVQAIFVARVSHRFVPVRRFRC
jgi:hypothetical protein